MSRRRLWVWSFAIVCSFQALLATGAHAQSATVNDDFIDTLVTATDLNAGIKIVRRMTVNISGCRTAGGIARCFLFMSAQAGGGSASVSLLRWGTTEGGCVNPVENSSIPSITPTTAAVLQVASAGSGGSSATGTVVLCYAANWLTAPARFTPTLFFRLYEN